MLQSGTIRLVRGPDLLRLKVLAVVKELNMRFGARNKSRKKKKKRWWNHDIFLCGNTCMFAGVLGPEGKSNCSSSA